MTTHDQIRVLIVDDQPAKLMSIKAVLSNLGVTILEASGADEALGLLLKHEVAVVLVDVCMPGTDGFELAELIRTHPRYGQTAIIFISAVHMSDADRLRGYGLGAVDYIQVPIIPEVLRAKVSIFTELYRKTRMLEQLNHDLERRVADRTRELEHSSAAIIDSERRYRELLQRLPVATYTYDRHGRITLFNEAAAELWGRRPAIDHELWCGTHALYTINGEPIPPAMSPMAMPLREGTSARGPEIIIERPDGSRRIVLPLPDAIVDPAGEVIGAVVMLLDVTDVHAAERDRHLLAAIVASSDDAIISRGEDGTITSWNAGAERIFGYTAAEAIGRHIYLLIPPDMREEEHRVSQRLRNGERVEHHETVRLAKDGQRVDVSLTISPLFDQYGNFIGISKVARDIRERKKAEALVARDKEMLEQLVLERTSELRDASERLRLADRMATIGTLSSGLGHDIGNLLLPMRMRLDAMERSSPSPELREDIDAIRQAAEYLQRLSASLRLLSLDPQHEAAETAATNLADWWREAGGMIRNGVPRSAMLTAHVSDTLPPIRIGKASLTQVVFNLVQNAGHAVRSRQNGEVTLSASTDEARGCLRLTVEDNGDGMTEEVRRRCLEPFFTSKTRELGSGMGLALVNGILKRIGGTIAVQSEPGRGTRIELSIPVCSCTSRPQPAGGRGVAVVRLKDPRMLAHIRSTLESLDYEVRNDGPLDGPGVWVGDATDPESASARTIAARRPTDRRVFLFEHGSPAGAPGSAVITIPHTLKPSAIRTLLCEALAGIAVESGR